MAFEARVFVQGVGVYLPHPNGKELLVLFPDVERAQRLGLHAADGEEAICRHYPVVQLSGGDVAPSLPEVWTTLDVRGHWIGFEAVPEDGALPGPLLRSGEEPIEGLPHLPAVMSAAELPEAGVDPAALPGEGFDPALLAAGLHAAGGVLSPASEFQGRLRFEGLAAGLSADTVVSGAMKIELGKVKSFKLKLRKLGETTSIEVPLTPRHDRLDVWIRHHCELDKPTGEADARAREAGTGEEIDHDFVANYSLLENAAALGERGTVLPIPTVSTSWLGGEPIGGFPVKCMGASLPPLPFGRPL